MHSTDDSCPILMKVGFSRKIFQKYSNIKLHDIPPVGVEVFHADRRTDMKNLFAVLRKRLKTESNKRQTAEQSWKRFNPCNRYSAGPSGRAV